MGCVYILKNPAMPDLIKIGYTTRTAEDRARELYEGMNGVPKPFIVVHINDCEEPRELEATVHERLAEYRVNKNREFFEYPADDAYKLVKYLHKESQQERKPLLSWEKIKKSPLISAIIANLLWGNLLKPIWTYIRDLLRKENQQERKPLLSWEKLKPLFSWKTITNKIIESFVWTSIANLLWDPLKSLGIYIWNFLRGPH